MSSDYIFECAKNFEELYSKASERLELLRAQKYREEDLSKIKTLLADMENILNTIELESSLMTNRQNATNEHNIAQTCRTHFNEIRKKFNKAESGELSRLLRARGDPRAARRASRQQPQAP